MKSIRSRRGKVVQIPRSRWLGYASAGAATALAGLNSAEADIHYSGVVNVPFPAGSSFVSSFALDNAAILQFGHFNTVDFAGGIALFRVHGAAVSNMFVGTGAAGSRYPSNLVFGANIAAGPFAAFNGNLFATLAYGNGFVHSKFLAPGTGFIGFRFNGGSGIEYGWARVTMEGSPENGFTLVDYAWSDVGTAITAGQTAVPEPGSLGLLAVGATGLLLWRKRRPKSAK
jgi:hypothetical protein